MAVKPITNKQVVNKSEINRGKQRSTRDITAGHGNRSKTYIPGLDFTKNYSITLKDVDTSIMNYVKNVIRPTIREANETLKVTVMYGNEERWKAVRKRGVIRDKNGSFILPLIMLRRTEISKSDTLPMFEHDVKRKYTDIVRQSKWSKDNRYDRFSVQTGKKAVYENFVTTLPNFVNITYEFILWTNFIEQMNPLVETFLEQNNNYWGDSTDYKFLCKLDSISDASEMNQDGERFIRSTFSIITNAYLLPEETNSVVTNKISNLQRKLTPSKVIFGFEGDATDKQVGK
jgi:hypothetical protein|tara:strand:- start:582 stop:1445 length:864 start_codon:yes stop_codon:yes gene_type:complete